MKKLSDKVQEMEQKAKTRNKENWDEQAEDGETTFQSHSNDTDYTKHTVSQTNEVIRSLQELNLNGMRVARMVIGRLDPTCLSEEQLKGIKIKSSDFRNFWGVSKSSTNEALKTGAKQLLSNVIEVETSEYTDMFPFATKARLIKGTGELVVDLNPELIPLFIDMTNKRYTKYNIIDLVNFESKYTIRLFELLTAQMGKSNKCDFFRKVEELRRILDVPKSYGHSMFMKVCIYEPLEEMKKYLGISSKVEQQKKEGGKKISHLNIEVERVKNFKLEMQDPDFPPPKK